MSAQPESHERRAAGASERWATRASLTEAAPPAEQSGLLLCAAAGDAVVPLMPQDRKHAIGHTSTTLAATGIEGADRVLVALNNDGHPMGWTVAEAASLIAKAAASAGPRGRMRLLKVMERIRPTVLVTTPTGATDLLSRMHLEFLVDPLDLGIRLILVTGELASERVLSHIGSEFGADVVELTCDPLFGVALAHRAAGAAHATVAAEQTVHLAPLDRDVDPGRAVDPGRFEVVTVPTWCSQLADLHLRTGYVVEVADGGAPSEDGWLPPVTNTVGDHILVRGRWLSLSGLEEALSGIDGIADWSLQVSRPGTLDRPVLRVSFERPSLVDNPMWRGRIREAVQAHSPVTIEIETFGQDDWEPVGRVQDERGQHLGLIRSEVG